MIKQQQQSAIILNSLIGNNINYNDNNLSALSVSLPTTTTGNPYPKTTNDARPRLRENKSSEGAGGTS
jgi:hypothetical protein